VDLYDVSVDAGIDANLRSLAYWKKGKVDLILDDLFALRF
jgi:hypothetical protein